MRRWSAIAVVVLAGCTPATRGSVEPPPPIELVVAPVDARPAPDATIAPPIDAPGVPPDLEIRLERAPCFGRCPVYTVTINARGEVFYSGLVPERGCATATIPPEAVARLAAQLEALGYFGLKDHYTDPVTDHPWAYTAVTAAGRHHQIAHYQADALSAPDLAERLALTEFERAIDELTGSPRRGLGRCDGTSAYPGVP